MALNQAPEPFRGTRPAKARAFQVSGGSNASASMIIDGRNGLSFYNPEMPLARHPLELRHGWIKMVPVITSTRPSYGSWFEHAGIIEACRRNNENVRHGQEGQKDRRAAGWTEAAALNGAAIARALPMGHVSNGRHIGTNEGDV